MSIWFVTSSFANARHNVKLMLGAQALKPAMYDPRRQNQCPIPNASCHMLGILPQKLEAPSSRSTSVRVRRECIAHSKEGHAQEGKDDAQVAVVVQAQTLDKKL